MIRNLNYITIASLTMLAGGSLEAQEQAGNEVIVAPTEVVSPTVPANAAPVAVISQPVGNVLKAGTPIKLRLMDTLSSKKKNKQKVGDRFQLEVAEPYVVNNLVIIPAGTRATGEITAAKKSGMWGKRGRLNASVLYMTLSDRQVRLSGAFDESGNAGTAGVVGAAVLLPVAGFFVKGSNAEILSGTQIEAYLDEDLAYSVPKELAPIVAKAVTAPAVIATETVEASSE